MEVQNLEERYLKNQARFGFTVLNKSRKNAKVCQAIEQYLEQYDIYDLPETRKDFLKNEGVYYRFMEFGDYLKEKLDLLISFYYNIKTTKGYYAYFEQGNENKVIPLAFWYSKHRLCAIWNWRKSQIIRQKYYSFLSYASDNHNRLLINHYNPIHLVLTVPHKDGIFKGKTFYAGELIKCFNALRKTEIWKTYVYGGEYGVEIKKSKSNGLHIHIHSFLLQNPQFKINEARYHIIKEFARITENQAVTDYILDFEVKNQSSFFANQTGVYDLFFKQLQKTKEVYTGISYESLYLKQDGKKIYLNPKTATVQDYLQGVMECIKYHFKPDCLEVEKGGAVDVELIEEILNNTKGKNLYNRFGAFRKEDELNFNAKDKGNEAICQQAPENETSTEEQDTQTSTKTVESKIINPFTQKPAIIGEYRLAVTNPKNLKYRDLDSKIPYEQYVYKQASKQEIVFAPSEWNLKTVIKLDIQGKLRERIEYQLYTQNDSNKILTLNNYKNARIKLNRSLGERRRN